MLKTQRRGDYSIFFRLFSTNPEEVYGTEEYVKIELF
jgi:hypothetical protein